MGPTLSRRAILFAIPLGLYSQSSRTANPVSGKKGKPLPAAGEFTRVIDGVTENSIVRLTNPAYVNQLPGSGNPFVSVKDRTLLFSSNRTGHLAPFQVDLRNGALKQIADAEKLDARSLCLDRSQKLAYFLDADKLRESALAKTGARTLGDGITWFRFGADGMLFVIQRGKLNVRDANGFRTIAESAIACWPQPNGAGCLFARPLPDNESEYWYLPLNASSQPALVAGGKIRTPFWDADGQSILFLRDVTDAGGIVKAQIHQRSLSGAPETCVSPTSQFATFAPNGDCSVFVGASRSHAQPNVVLLLRSPNREMTLCEHGSKHPADVLPAFSPDSRRVYFESDREGNPAIYSVNVEYLVEPLATGA